MAPIIRTENLTHIYSGATPFEMMAIHDINFQAEKGEFIGLIGHTGSGKSTLIQHLNGLIPPTSGKVYFNEEDIWSSKERSRFVRFQVGLVFQYPEYQLFEETVYKDIAFGPKNMKLSEEEIDQRVRQAAQFVGLSEDVMEKSPFELSGGQKRRVAIAGVIAMRPQVLILDEPTAGLDPAGCESILQNIHDYHKATESTIIMVSHNMEETARFASRLVVLNQGQIAFDGTPAQVFSHAEALREMGLAIPQATQICHRLRELGLPIDASIYTIQQAEEALLKLKGGSTAC